MLTRFWLFWPPTPLCWHFLWYERWQKVDIFKTTYLPCLLNVVCEQPLICLSIFDQLKGGLPLPPAFQYLILMTWRACDLDLVIWYLHWLQNGKALKLKCPFFSCFMKLNWRLLCLKSWHFEASEDIMTKFKSQTLHVINQKLKSWWEW